MRSSALQRLHPYAWLWEPLMDDPTFLLRSMFGAKAVYLHGKIMLCFMARDEDPWRGVLICTDRERHCALLADFPEAKPHPVLPKWLYLPDSFDAFDRQAERLVRLVARQDPRIGVIPKPRTRRRAGSPRRKI